MYDAGRARAPGSAGEVDLERAVALGGPNQAVDRRLRQGCATEVGVERDAGCVHHPSRVRTRQRAGLALRASLQCLGVHGAASRVHRNARGEARALVRQRPARGLAQRPTGQLGPAAGQGPNQHIQGRKGPARVGLDLGFRIHDFLCQIFREAQRACPTGVTASSAAVCPMQSGRKENAADRRSRPLESEAGSEAWQSRTGGGVLRGARVPGSSGHTVSTLTVRVNVFHSDFGTLERGSVRSEMLEQTPDSS